MPRMHRGVLVVMATAALGLCAASSPRFSKESDVPRTLLFELQAWHDREHESGKPGRTKKPFTAAEDGIVLVRYILGGESLRQIHLDGRRRRIACGATTCGAQPT